jgi:hypothetical protein
MSRVLQRSEKLRSQAQSDGSSLGLIENGEFFAKKALTVRPTAPGSASGKTWLGHTRPQFPAEHPAPNAPRSITVTCHPTFER